MKEALQANPELARAYDLYSSCRAQTVVPYQTSKGKDTIQRLSPWTTGYAVLPEDGGMLDQPYRLMELFDSFMDGERWAFYNPR